MNADGSNPHQIFADITTTPTFFQQYAGLAWTPDASRVLVLNESGGSGPYFAVVQADGSGYTIATVSVVAGENIQTGVQDRPAVSPDGTKVALNIEGAVSGTRNQLVTVNLDGTGRTTVATAIDVAEQFIVCDWVDASNILCLVQNAGANYTGHIEIVSLGGTRTVIYDDMGVYSNSLWSVSAGVSPDGTKVAFGRGGNIPLLAIVGIGGGTVTSISGSPSAIGFIDW